MNCHFSECWGFWIDRAVALSLSMLLIECVTRYLLTSVSLWITVHSCENQGHVTSH